MEFVVFALQRFHFYCFPVSPRDAKTSPRSSKRPFQNCRCFCPSTRRGALILCVDRIPSPPNRILCVAKMRSGNVGEMISHARARARGKYSSVHGFREERISADEDTPNTAQPAKKMQRLALAAACTCKKSLKAPR